MKQDVLICIKDYRSGIENNKEGLPFKSGAEFHAERHAQEMTKQGHFVTVFAKKRLRHTLSYEKIDGYALHRLFPLLRSFQLIWNLLVRYRRANVLHIMGRPDFAAFAVPVAQMLGMIVALETTIVGEVFERKIQNKVWRYPLKALRQILFKKCDLFIANSQEMADDLVMQGIEAGKIRLHPQGVDVKRFYPANELEKEALRRQLELPLQGVLYLFCCRIVQRKGIDLLLDAWEKAGMKNKGAQLVLVGGGAREWLDKIEHSMVSDDTIRYIPEVPDPVPYYRACDVYVFPSRKEGLPTSLMEAMACGLAPVVSAIGGNVDLVDEQEKCGLRCEFGNSESLGEQLLRLVEEPGLYAQLGQVAREKIEKQFNRSQLVEELLEIYAMHANKNAKSVMSERR